MHNYRKLLLGFLLVFFLGGGALYWITMTPDEQVTQSEPAPVSASSQSTTETTSDDESEQTSKATADAAASGTDLAKPQQDPEAQSDAVSEQPEDTASDSSVAKAVVPEFDVLRVEADGSLVIAGHATPDAEIELLAGSRILGTAKAGPNGDFAIVLDRALSAGDHQLVLRATLAGGTTATSSQTAIVSVPSNSSGQVLALVEEPGLASRLITRPEAAPASQDNVVAVQEDVQEDPNNSAQAPTEKQPSVMVPSTDIPLAIEAVEIDGQSIFVAGSAQGAKDPGNTVSVKANDIVLGVSAVSSERRFLIQSQQPLAVGDYIIRADLLDNAGRIIATARVPFRRVAGENLSAIATETVSQSDEGSNEATPSALQKVDGSVIIRRGDNLWTISKRTYGHGLRYTTIYLANRDQISDPDLIWPGQVFVMPQEPLADDEVRRQLKRSAD